MSGGVSKWGSEGEDLMSGEVSILGSDCVLGSACVA